jgi:GTP-binding protein
MSLPVVALVGRPNVGKSALFNRLVGEHTAIVSEEAGTTRDRHFGRVEWNGRAFWLVDTGGLVEDSNVPMDVEIRKQVLQAIGEADLMVFVADAKVGVHPSDARVVDLLRDSGKPFVLAANKVDNPQSSDYFEFYRMGAGEPQPVSAANGMGSGDLLDAITEHLPELDEALPEALRVAVIGRPNVGKSSFVNRLLGEERLVVTDVAGTTRDSIDTPFRYHGRDFVFVDTAGLRRQAKVDDGVEFYSTLRSRRAIEGADICVLLIDATLGLENQDLKIATLAWEAGRGLIFVVNKWDLKEKDDKTADKFKKEAVEKVPYLAWVPFLYTSALTGQRVTKIMELLLEVEAERNKRIPTSRINETLEALVNRTQPPQSPQHQDVRLIYASQVETAPPAIAVFGNHPDAVPEHYIRYLHNGFRAEYGFLGNPLRILMRAKNAPATDHRRVRGEGRPRRTAEQRWRGEEAAELAQETELLDGEE